MKFHEINQDPVSHRPRACGSDRECLGRKPGIRRAGDKETSPAPAPPPITAADVQALKDAMAAQQQQIERLTLQLQQAQRVWQSRQPAPEAAGKTAAASAGQPQPALSEGKSEALATEPVNNSIETRDPRPGAVDAAISGDNHPDQPETFNTQMEGPIITIHFRGINITPGGYAEAAFVRRSRALGADLPTPFNSLTMPGASQSQLSEFFGSARQSGLRCTSTDV